LLGIVKKEFGLFTGLLEKTQKKLQEASNSLEDATKRTKTMEKKLKNVESINSDEPSGLSLELKEETSAES